MPPRFKVGERITVENPKFGPGVWPGVIMGLKKGRKPYDVQFDDGDRFDCAESWTELEADRPATEDTAKALTFSLERDLQAALRNDVERLEAGLKITDGGEEQRVESGKIDITAEDPSGTVVVIELKVGSADRDAIGQLLSYMGDLAKGAAGSKVRGIVVASDFSPRAVAASLVPNIELKKYSFEFSFASAT